jgi:uncharacterized protein DUF2752
MFSNTRPAMLPAARAFRAAAVVAGVWVIAALPYASGLASCPTARLFHLPCPGCGMTRALLLLAHAEVAASLAMHPLALPTAVSQIVLAIATVAATARWGAPWLLVRARWGRLSLAFVAAIFALDLVVWGARAFGALGGPVPV